MSGKRNKSAGSKFEREEAKIYREMGFKKACTSRAESRNLDNQKVDLAFTIPFNIQLKLSLNNPNYHEILNIMPDSGINVICHGKVEKSQGGRFIQKGKYCTMKAEDYYKLLKLLIETYGIDNLSNLLK